MSENWFLILNSAKKLREQWFSPDTNVIRLLNRGENHQDQVQIETYADKAAVFEFVPLDRQSRTDIIQALQKIGYAEIYFKDRLPSQRKGENQTTKPLIVFENAVPLYCWLDSGLQTGIFPDQRNNRLFLVELANRENYKTLLNGFCYTGAFTVFLARCGLETCSVDLSKVALNRLKMNLELNQIHNQRLIPEDYLEFIKRLARQKKSFDLIVCDPPTFAHKKKEGDFSVLRDLEELIEGSFHLLNRGGTLFFSSNASSLSQSELENRIRLCLKPAAFKFLPKLELPLDFCPQGSINHLCSAFVQKI